MTKETPHQRATDIVEQLTKPLDPVYAGAKDFLWDFWSDMPWTPEKAAAVASEILCDENLRFIVRAFDVQHGLVGDVAIETGMMVYACQNFDEDWVAP